MKKGKIIVIEGTDCSGKETQSKILIDKLNKEGLPTEYLSFPQYNSPTGKIVGLPFLGKENIAEKLIVENFVAIRNRVKEKYPEEVYNNVITEVLKSTVKELAKGWFEEGAPNVDPKISSLYYLADRGYNVNLIKSVIASGRNLVLDRYTYSNMAHQGSKISNKDERYEMYEWIRKMEFEMMNLPETDIKLFLHMPNSYADILRKRRINESLDENERDSEYMLRSEKAYVEVANLFNFDTISCIDKKNEDVVFEDIKTPEEINEEVYKLVKTKLMNR